MPDKKIGRPLSQNPKGIKITVRFDNKTYSDLENYCNRVGLTKAETLRRGFYKLKEDTQKEE